MFLEDGGDEVLRRGGQSLPMYTMLFLRLTPFFLSSGNDNDPMVFFPAFESKLPTAYSTGVGPTGLNPRAIAAV